MKTYLRDQKGVAMLFEVILVAAVLGIVGLAVYQAGHRTKTANVQTTPPSPSTTEGLAASAAAAAEAESTSDASISADAESAAGEVSASNDDMSNLGASFNESNF